MKYNLISNKAYGTKGFRLKIQPRCDCKFSDQDSKTPHLLSCKNLAILLVKYTIEHDLPPNPMLDRVNEIYCCQECFDRLFRSEDISE